MANTAQISYIAPMYYKFNITIWGSPLKETMADTQLYENGKKREKEGRGQRLRTKSIVKL